MLLDGGERVILDARDYEPCAPTPTGPVTPHVEKGQDKLPVGKGRDDTGGIDPTASDTLTMLGSGTIGRGVIPKLVDSFAGFRGARVSTTYAGDTQSYAISEPNGTKPFLTITVTLSGSKTSLPALIDGKTQVGMTSAQYADEQVAALLRLRGLSLRSEVEHVLALDELSSWWFIRATRSGRWICATWRKSSRGKPNTGREAARKTHRGSQHLFEFRHFRGFKGAGDGPVPRAAGFPAVVLHTAQPEGEGGRRGEPVRYRFFGQIGTVGNGEDSEHWRALRRRGCADKLQHQIGRLSAEPALIFYTPYHSKNAESFLNFILVNIEAQEALKGGSTTDQTIETALQIERLRLSANLPENNDELFPIFRRDVAGAERASISFRFQFGSDKLDTKGQADVLRLVRYLQAVRPRQILLAGFTDDVGSVSQNRRLAENRAQAVRAAIARIDPSLLKYIEVKGYGKVPSRDMQRQRPRPLQEPACRDLAAGHRACGAMRCLERSSAFSGAAL